MPPVSAARVVTGDATPAQNLSEQRQAQLQRHAHHGRMASAIGRGVAHELRNVAQLVGMLRDAMKHDLNVPGPLMDAVTLADATLMRQIGTLERLPPVTRHTLPVALADIVDRSIELIRRRRRGAKMTFLVDVPRDLPPVMAIENDLDQALWELLVNAREAAELRGHGTIQIRAVAQEDEIVLSVEDDGPGIQPSVRDDLFAAFTSSHPSDDHLGIGLTMARRLVEENGGELTADPEVATGSRFVMRLPIFRRGGSGSYAVLV